MNKVTNEQLDSLIKSAVNSSGPLPHDEKFSQIISALRELRTHRNLINERGNFSKSTNNHPAHGPVSLDRLHQISEILSKAAAQSDGGNLGYAMADAVKAIDELLSVRKMAAKEAVYQVLDDGSWTDYSKQQLEGLLESKPSTLFRVVYPSPSLTQPVLVDEDDNFYSWFGREWEKYYQPNNYSLSAKKHLGAIAESAWFACRSAMLQASNFREIPNSSTNNCREISETSTNEHEIETHTLLKSIEGMEVSVDVSTCDADAGHRYFGTVTEISELDTAKNGYILLVQDAKPNFKPAGNSPVTPDCWCRTCRPVTMNDMRFVVCPECGNKRCPHANDHRYACSGSNAPCQEGSAYPAAPQQEVNNV